MAQDFLFGIDIETSVTNEQEAILALQKIKKEMEDVSKGIKIDVSEEEISRAKIQINALEKTIKELKVSGGEFGEVYSKNLKNVQVDFKNTAKEVKKTTKEVEDLNRATKDQNSGFSNISKTAKIATRDIQGTTSQLDSLKQNLQQGIGQTLAFGAINMIGGAMSDSVEKAKELDKIMTDISIVSGKTSKEMEKYRDYAGDAAHALGTMGSEYLEASLIYEQQGGMAAYYAKDLADATVIAANISRESTSQMSEYLTATINGFDMLREHGSQAGMYVADVLSKLGAASGSDLAEIATGLTRTANTARDVNFEFEEIATMIATVSEVTRRTPETIGNAFKSMLTTFTQLREASDEELNAFTNKVEEAFKLGGIEQISVFDNGRLRDASDIFKDIAAEWHTMNVEQQSLVSESVAGKYQAETFRAFMNNQDRYNELLSEAYGASGTAAQQQLVYMNSIEAKLNQVGNQWEIISTNIIDSDLFKGILDDATNLLKVIGAQDNAITSLAVALTPVVGIFGQLFGSKFVGESVQNSQLNKLQKSILEDAEALKNVNGKAGDEMYRQVSAGQELNKVMSTLGKDAGQNFKELVEEADKLQSKIDEINVSDEELNRLIEERTQKLATEGGAPGLQGGKATAEQKKEEEKLLSENQRIPLLKEEIALEEKKHVILRKNRAIGSNANAAKEAVALAKETGLLYEETQATIKETSRELEDWLNLERELKQSKKKSKESAEDMEFVTEQIVKAQKKINDAVEKEKNLRSEIIAEKKAEVAREEKEIKMSSARTVVKRQVEKEVSNLGDMQATIEMNKKVQKGFLTAADKTRLAASATKGLSFAYSTLVPIAGTVNAILKDQISVQDGLISSMQTVGSMLMFAPGPWAKLASAAVFGLSMIVDKFDIFMTKGEKAKEVNDSLITSFLSLQESTKADLDSIRSIEEVYGRLQGVDAASLLASSDVDPEILEEYLEVSQKIAEVRPDLVKYYDEEGRAVVDLSNDYKELIEAQKKNATSASGILASGRNSFLTQYTEDISGAKKQIEELTEKSVEAKKKLEDSKSREDEEGISGALAEIAEINNTLSQAQKTISDIGELANTNILQPFYNSSEELRKLNDELGISSDILKDFSYDFIDQTSLTGLIQAGDIEGTEAVFDNLSLIYEEYYKIAEIDGQDKANSFIEGIAESSELSKASLYQTTESIEKLQEALERKSGSSWIEDIAINGIHGLKEVDEELEKINERKNKIYEIKSRRKSGEVISFKEIEKELDNLENEPTEIKFDVNLEEIMNSFDMASRSAKGFEEGLAEIGKQELSIEGLKDIAENGLNTESLEKLAQYMPEIAKGVEEGSIDAEEALYSLTHVQNASITGMMMNNQAFFEDWKEKNKDKVAFSQETFGIELSSASTLAEAKVMLEGATLEQLRTIAAQRVSDSMEADQAVDKSSRITYSNMITNSGIWGDSTLTTWEKLKLIMLNILDEIDNAFANMVSGITGKVANLVDSLPKVAQKALGVIGLDGDSIRGNTKAFLGDGFNRADKEREKIAERQRKEQEEREKLIQDILDGPGIGGNTDLFQANADKYIKSSLSGLSIPEFDGGDGDEDKEIDFGSNDDNKEKEVEDLKLVINQYYKLENALKKVKDQYDLLGQKKKAAYGEDKLRLMTQEQELLVKETNLLKQNSAALSQEQKDVKKHLSSYGFTFDRQGEIKNLNERLLALQNEANKQSGVAKEASIEAIKSLQEEAARYSEITFNLLPDKEKAIAAAKETFSQIAKEKVEYAIQIKVDKYGLQKEILDTITEMQDTFETLDDKMKYTTDSAKVSLNEIALLRKAMDEVKNNPALTDSDRAEMLQKYQKELLSAVGTARSAYAEMQKIQEDFISQTVEKIEEVNSGYERILEKSQTMIEKSKELYGNGSFGQISGIYETQEKALESQLAHLESSQLALLRYRDTLDKNSQAWKKTNEQIIEIGKSIDSNLVAKIDLLKSKFEDFSNSLFDKFEGLFGVWGFDGASEDFDKLIDKTNEYMSSYEKMTIIGAKIKSINEEIAKTNDPKRAAELVKYRDKELLTLMQQETVSQDEYERALKLYEIKQKELALQERENASRIAQLVRDENGNMSYEYVRQETESTQKEIDELNDAKNDLYEFDSEKVRDASKKIFSIIKEYQGKLKELQDKGLSPEDYKKELEKLLAGTQAEIDAQQAIVDKWMRNVGKDGFSSIMDLFGQGAISAEQLGIDESLMRNILDGLKDGSLTYQDILSGNFDSFSSSIGASSKEVESAMSKIMEVVLGDNKVITDELKNASDKWTSTAKDNVSSLGEAYKKYMTEADRVLKEYNKTTGSLNNLLGKTNEASKKVRDSIQKQTDAMIKTKKESDLTANSVKNLEKMLIGSGNGGLFGSMIKIKNEQNNKLQPSIKTTKELTKNLGDTVNVAGGRYKYMGEKAEEARQRVISYSDKKTKQGVKDIESAGKAASDNKDKYDKWKKSIDKTKTSMEDLIKSMKTLPGMQNFLGKNNTVRLGLPNPDMIDVSKFDTGGYTGTWENSTNNSTGKMAMLHEKELVLNRYDTENILEAVKLQRSITEKLQNMRSGTSNTINRVSEVINNRNDNRNITQPITINASFPDVSSSTQIESAFEGLIGKAAMHIGKK